VLVAEGATSDFAPRETEILRLAAAGKTNAEIGATMFLAPGTVKHHLIELFDKLGAPNRAAAVHAARRLGVLPDATLSPAAGEPAAAVSPRERDVLAAFARGATNRTAARALGLSPHTVKQHASSIYRKLGVRNRAEAVHRADELGLL
jgi:DNA-binding NarL/FixJ family response regulator